MQISAQTAVERWGELDSERQSFITRCEKYAAMTKPKLCTPVGYNQQQVALQHDYQSIGAQGVNHVSNKLMLALFAPSRPFFRLDPGETAAEEMSTLGTPDQISAMLAQAEKIAVRVLDQRAVRPKLYEATQHLIVTGNVLLITKDKTVRVLGIKKYCVKRAGDGTLIELVTREEVAYASLDKKTKESLTVMGKASYSGKDKVCVYRWIRLEDSTSGEAVYKETQWVNDCQLPEAFSSQSKPDDLPYRAATWDLADGDDYGTGLVEDYQGDFSALSMISEATVYAAILNSEFRWLVRPGAQTKAEDLKNSANGSALPGEDGDITVLTTQKHTDLSTNLALAELYIGRIGRGFMLQSAVTRNAERVTAEEIRLTADELETSFGGAYSRIAVDLQTPLARWLMKQSGQDIANKDIKPTIVTGMDALSRAGDRENLMLFLGDLVSLGQLPPEIRDRLKTDSVIAQFAAARGLGSQQYLVDENTYKAIQQQRQAQAMVAQQQMIQTQADADTQVAAVKQGAK